MASYFFHFYVHNAIWLCVCEEIFLSIPTSFFNSAEGILVCGDFAEPAEVVVMFPSL
jgi:hypothetical protein